MNLNRTKLFFLAPGDVLKGRVEPIMWMRMCQSFANMGLSVELVTVYTYRKENIRRQQIYEHYGIREPNFTVTILPTPMTVNTPTWWFRASSLPANFVYGLAINMLRKEHRRYHQLIFYSRSPAAIYPYWTLRKLFKGALRPLFVFETHALPFNPEAIAILRRMDGVVVSSQKLAQDMQSQIRIKAERLHLAYLAPHILPSKLSQEEARRELGLSDDREYIVYTGKLLLEEVILMLDAAEVIDKTDHNIQFLFIGGNPEILKHCRTEVEKRRLCNVTFTGFIAPSDVVLYQLAASILLEYLVKNRVIIQYITPGKVFDYLQAGRPIIASDYPILHEILQHNKNALLVTPEAPVVLAQEILRVLNEPNLAARLSQQALYDSQKYSWEQRTLSIWNFIKQINSQVLHK